MRPAATNENRAAARLRFAIRCERDAKMPEPQRRECFGKDVVT